jgi:hypothetical protein
MLSFNRLNSIALNRPDIECVVYAKLARKDPVLNCARSVPPFWQVSISCCHGRIDMWRQFYLLLTSHVSGHNLQHPALLSRSTKTNCIHHQASSYVIFLLCPFPMLMTCCPVVIIFAAFTACRFDFSIFKLQEGFSSFEPPRHFGSDCSPMYDFYLGRLLHPNF